MKNSDASESLDINFTLELLRNFCFNHQLQQERPIDNIYAHLLCDECYSKLILSAQDPIY